jgi:hypothetical protein
MPDHLHAMLSFARDESMSEVIRDWKRFHTRTSQIVWQEGYFDHRLRADERGMSDESPKVQLYQATIRRQSRISNALMTTRSTCTPFAKRALGRTTTTAAAKK